MSAWAFRVGTAVSLGLLLWSCGGGGGGSDPGGGGSGPLLGKGSDKSLNFSESLGVGVNMDMAFVKGGTFTMGCTPEQGEDCLDSEKPAHHVTVDDFFIGKHEVTQKQWKTVMGESNNPSHFKGDDLPVENVSWNDAQEFIRKLNTALGKKYRLPTESEWEFAARGGTKSKSYKYSGSNNLGDVGWYYENSGDSKLDDKSWDVKKLEENKNRTRPVGTKKPNELGIHDMSGNVWEWVSDWYGEYTAISKSNPAGPEGGWGSYRVIRGGSWGFDAKRSRVSDRSYDYSGYRHNIQGFRLAVSP